MKSRIDDVLAVVWSQHLEADYVCDLKHCPFCKIGELNRQIKELEKKNASL